MSNNSVLIFHSHINSLLTESKTYNQLAFRLGVTTSCLKSWTANSRCPSIRTLDRIASKIGCKTFQLIKDSKLISGVYTQNDAHTAFCRNINRIFIEHQCFSLAEKLALLDEEITDYTLKSYLRTNNYKLPTLQKLDAIADAIAMHSYQLLEE